MANNNEEKKVSDKEAYDREIKSLRRLYTILGLLLLILIIGNGPEVARYSEEQQKSHDAYNKWLQEGKRTYEKNNPEWKREYEREVMEYNRNKIREEREKKNSDYSSYTNSDSVSRNKQRVNSLNNDPADYDDPEEYADDAWGDDYDDWDEAYEAWENY